MKSVLSIFLLSLCLSASTLASNEEVQGHEAHDHDAHEEHAGELKGHEQDGHEGHAHEAGHDEDHDDKGQDAHEEHTGEPEGHEQDGHEDHAHEAGHDEDHDDHGQDAHEEHTGEPESHEQEGHEGHAHEAGRDEDHDDHGHDEGGYADDDEHGNEVHLRPEQLSALGIRTERLMPRAIGQVVSAPGEVRINAYATARVAPRIAAQVVDRHARLGNQVAAGQALVTLSSVEMAQAQGELVVASREWQRVRGLGRKVVSESRYLEAQIGQQQSHARVVSFGMTPEQVDELLRAGAKKADGTFILLAPRSGTIIADDFVVGEIIEAGRSLFDITDESVRWVEARLAPADAAEVGLGNRANITFDGVPLPGKVTQIHHVLDETTRTRAVRIEAPDPGHRLHPGQFVDVALETGKGKPVMALPEEAVLRSPDGDWQVFIAGDEPGAFEPVEIRRVSSSGGLVIIDGLQAGTEVVVHGAFFLASELAKGGFDPHNH